METALRASASSGRAKKPLNAENPARRGPRRGVRDRGSALALTAGPPPRRPKLRFRNYQPKDEGIAAEREVNSYVGQAEEVAQEAEKVVKEAQDEVRRRAARCAPPEPLTPSPARTDSPSLSTLCPRRRTGT